MTPAKSNRAERNVVGSVQPDIDELKTADEPGC